MVSRTRFIEGSVCVKNGLIASVDEGARVVASAEDFNALINVRQNIKRQHAPSNRAAIAEICHKRGIPLADVGAKASSKVADALGFDDHGEIAPGKRADLVCVTLVKDVPVVCGIWRQGGWIN